MGTAKRERQKANRQQRQAEEAKIERNDAVKRNVLRWTIGGIAAIGAVVLIAWVGGAFSGDDEETAATVPLETLPVDTTPVVTYPVPPKPDVELPEPVPTELVTTVIVPGEGPEAQVGDTVTVHYVGVLSADGTEFDNSYDRGAPFPVTLGAGGVIVGWDQGLEGVQAGAQIQLDIPASLAYGDNPREGGVIQPGDALTFVIDVMDVEPAG